MLSSQKLTSLCSKAKKMKDIALSGLNSGLAPICNYDELSVKSLYCLEVKISRK
jgi:hypothetical protein